MTSWLKAHSRLERSAICSALCHELAEHTGGTAGRPTISPEATEALIQAASQEEVPGQSLTEREREVLLLMVEGLNNTQIAGKLTVSPSTIKSHVSSILAKLGVTSRTEAVTLALRHKLAS
jgi:NarL family two-component system response regulator LiaR